LGTAPVVLMKFVWKYDYANQHDVISKSVKMPKRIVRVSVKLNLSNCRTHQDDWASEKPMKFSNKLSKGF